MREVPGARNLIFFREASDWSLTGQGLIFSVTAPSKNVFLLPMLQILSTSPEKLTFEKVQRRAARYVVGDFQKTSSVTGILKELNWETLEESRIKSRIRTLHKIITNQLAIDGQKFFKDKPQSKRRGHDRQLVLHETPYSTLMKDSFFVEAVEY